MDWILIMLVVIGLIGMALLVTALIQGLCQKEYHESLPFIIGGIGLACLGSVLNGIGNIINGAVPISFITAVILALLTVRFCQEMHRLRQPAAKQQDKL